MFYEFLGCCANLYAYDRYATEMMECIIALYAALIDMIHLGTSQPVYFGDKINQSLLTAHFCSI